MARSSSSKASGLTNAERQLEELHAETLRKQRELEKKLKHLPVQLAEQKERKREQAHQRAVSAGPAISSRPGGGGRGRSRGRQMPSKKRGIAKRKTLILLLALGIMVFLLWNITG